MKAIFVVKKVYLFHSRYLQVLHTLIYEQDRHIHMIGRARMVKYTLRSVYNDGIAIYILRVLSNIIVFLSGFRGCGT